MKLKLTYLALIFLIIIGIAITLYMVKRARQLDARMRQEGYHIGTVVAEGRF